MSYDPNQPQQPYGGQYQQPQQPYGGQYQQPQQPYGGQYQQPQQPYGGQYQQPQQPYGGQYQQPQQPYGGYPGYGVPAAAAGQLGSWGARFVAYLIDGIILLIPWCILGFILGGASGGDGSVGFAVAGGGGPPSVRAVVGSSNRLFRLLLDQQRPNHRPQGDGLARCARGWTANYMDNGDRSLYRLLC
ncbi:MAG: hypothetical protein KatS3mg057_2963 [Herpetosiphonaceae bacterium]|nr:MAG: hypothetical protein KatS3mg057_2963 [Herpetosiphonaceae bacterium]